MAYLSYSQAGSVLIASHAVVIHNDPVSIQVLIPGQVEYQILPGSKNVEDQDDDDSMLSLRQHDFPIGIQRGLPLHLLPYLAARNRSH